MVVQGAYGRESALQCAILFTCPAGVFTLFSPDVATDLVWQAFPFEPVKSG